MIPNCNGSENDISVFVAAGTKIKVYSKKAGIDTEDTAYQEWTLAGLNRRLADSEKPYTIFARLSKTDKENGYVVFAPKTYRNGVWIDKYSSVTVNGLSVLYTENGMDFRMEDPNYWWIRLGDVTLPENNLRAITLDTGILGTDQYNEEWELEPDAMPLRVELSCSIDGKDAGQTPYVPWEKTLRLKAILMEGWADAASGRVDHWTITRNTGNLEADAEWNEAHATTFRQYGEITLAHTRNARDDFGGMASVPFTITAWNSEDNVIAETTVSIMAETIESELLNSYTVDFSDYVDVVTVDDVGNVIGGLWTLSGDNNEFRNYRIYSAISVRNNGVLLVVAADDEDAGEGTYKIYAQPKGCSCVIENSTVYITSINNIKDGVAGSADDVNFDYDAMRNMDSCSVDLIIDCEGKGSIVKNIPIRIKHDSQPFVGADITNEFSAVSWNTKTQRYVGLPISFDMKMWHNNEVLDIASVSDVSLTTDTAGVTLVNGTAPDTPAAGSVYYTKSIATIVVNQGQTDQYSYKVARINITAMGADVPLVTNLHVTCVATYSGIQYERTLVHTVNKGTDTNVYSLLPSVSEVLVNRNASTPTLSEDYITCSVVCDSSDDKHYTVNYADFATHKLALYYRKHYTSGTQDQDETPYTNQAIRVDSDIEKIAFFLYGLSNGSVDRDTIHDAEEVPVIATGQDGKGVEYIFFQQNSETPKPTINDVADSRNVDNYCPYNSDGTQQWTDEPVGVGANSKFEFYAQRKKVNGVWQPFGDVHIWNSYTTDGISPYIIDLSNEQSFINCDQNGNVTGSYENSRLMLFKGTSYAFTDFDEINITPVNISCNNSTASFKLSNNAKQTAQMEGYYTLDISDISAAAAQVNIECIKNSPSIKLIAVYKINKNIAGGKGMDAVTYSLIPSLNVIHKSNGSFTDSTLSIQVKKTVGTTSTILSTYQAISDEGLSLYYSASGGSETPLQTVNIGTSTFVGNNGTYGILRLKDSSNVIVDSERINVVEDGEPGAPGAPGIKGDDSVIYELLPSQSVISFTRGADGTTLTPSSVNIWCNYAKIVGNEQPVIYLGTIEGNIYRPSGAMFNMFFRLHYADGSYSIWDWTFNTNGLIESVSVGVVKVESTTTHNNKQYVAVEFCLSTSNGYSTVADENIIARTTVAIKKDGTKGNSGEGIFVHDRGIFTPGTTYDFKRSGDVYVRDMVRYEIGGIMYGFLVKPKGESVSSAPISADGDPNWEAVGIVNTVIANTVFGTNANIGGFMASANRLDTSQTAYRVIYRGFYAAVTTKAVYRGTWQSGTTYYGSANDSSEGINYKDVVYYGGSYYIPRNGGAVSNTSTPPPANSTEWQLISTSSWEYAAVGNEKAYYPKAPYVFSDDIDVPRRHMVLYKGSYYVVKRIGTKIFSSLPTDDVWRLANSEEIAAVNSELKENNEPYVDIPVFTLNGVEGTMRMRQKDDTVWSVDNSGKNVLGEEAGQRVEISPTSKEISIFNESGALSATFDGTTVVSMDSMFGNTIGSVSTTDGKRSASGNGVIGMVDSGIVLISSAFTVNGPATVLARYNLTANGKVFTSTNPYAGGASGSVGTMPTPEKEGGYYYFRNYATLRICIVKENSNGGYTEVRTLAGIMASGQTVRRNETNISSYIPAAGTYYIAAIYSLGVYPDRNYDAYVQWSDVSLSFTSNIYLARIFANGFSYGSSANNFVAAVNEGGNSLRFKCVTNNGKSGIEVSADGIKAMSNGIWGKITPTILIVFVDYSQNTGSLTAITRYSAVGGTATVEKVSRGDEGQIEVTFPSGFSDLNLHLENTMVIITPYGRENVNGHLISFNGSNLVAEFNDDTSNNLSSFLLELKYFG